MTMQEEGTAGDEADAGEQGPTGGAELTTPDGRTVRYFDTGAPTTGGTVLWHHGTPQTGAIIPPIAAAADAAGLRVVSVARPGYPGSTENPGRTIASAAADALLVLDALGIDTFVTAGASGGGPHALACAAIAPDRVTAVATIASLAPRWDTDDWFDGMASPEALLTAIMGRDARLHHAERAEFDESSFTDRDWAALSGAWGPLGADAQAGSASGPAGESDDDVAYVTPWGIDLAAVTAPTLLVHGGADRVVPVAHAHALLDRIPNADLLLRQRDGHVSALAALPLALVWLRDPA
ncbi:alpha/beta fold hydrolase [Leifsonia sp. NPDC102414]|uniref:alpha/beta fold hydrolase n=1 Tax=unclassified Leifsonia TaxID=2663824 RepID=UPI000ACB71BA|nr:alpha/beta hydrolase [Leifsonia sp. Root227]